MQYSPKLKKAMAAIKDVLEAYDIAGIIVIHTPGHSEYINHISPSYSCAKQEGDNLRIRAKASDYNGDVDMRNQKIKDTSNMLHILSEVGGRNALMMMEVSENLDQIVGATHDGGGHSSHTTQNN